MKKQVKGFGQFVNEAGLINGFSREIDHGSSSDMDRGSDSGSMEGIKGLAMFYVEGMHIAGKLTFAASGRTMDIDFPREDAEHWESSDWHRYVCGIAQEKGATAVYFPEDDIIVDCE